MPHFTNGDNHSSGCLAARDHVASLTEVEIMSHSPEFLGLIFCIMVSGTSAYVWL